MKEELSYQKYLEMIKGEKKEEKREERKEKKVKKRKVKRKKREKEGKILKKEEKIETEEKEIIEPEEVTTTEILPEAVAELEEEEKEEEFLVFKVGSEYYSILTAQANEVVTSVEIVEAHGLPEYAIGMANFRNKMIPVISLGKLLKIKEEEKPYSYIFIEKGKENVFLRAGEIKGIYRKKDVKLLDVPYDLDRNIFKKILLINEELAPLIDVIRLIEKKE